MSQRVVAQGGNEGVAWNDGLSKGIRKVFVGTDPFCVTYVKFEYVKDSTVESHEHGTIVHPPQEFVVNYPKEYITSVEGTYAQPASTRVITSLVFKTSQGRTSPTFGNHKFVLASNGQKLVGFHGRAGDALDAIGAYYLSDSSLLNKLEAEGGPTGGIWNDGVYSDVRKVYVERDEGCVRKLKIDYVKDGVPETHDHGNGGGAELEEFLLDPNEYITSVDGTYGKMARFGNPVITSIAFTTSKGRTSLTFGSTKFVLEDNGRQLVGFHGRSEATLNAIGAHFALTTGI